MDTHTEKKDEHPVTIYHSQLTIGQRAADKMTTFLGSWTFIILFGVFLVAWMAINVVAYKFRWDPYPFILLNLCLSCLAATQAPVIMMSQNRQTERDRLTTKYDYAVNRKAEREIQKLQKDLKEIKKMITDLKK
ncbi:MAG TPA: hypothetical protein DCS29_04580 [Candidatus Magasanikbacteria bacterium]|nr:MAG: hypothetical protein A2479_03040 [Candidatus Magasanikbacteria bacterium RIFOXYC2_FULL_39_8]HAT04016.1 hypothetical protein [Candidatus Magasanikbacteria bacterium]